MGSRLGFVEARPSLEGESVNEPVNGGRRVQPSQGTQVAFNPFDKLKVDAVQKAAALRYQTW